MVTDFHRVLEALGAERVRFVLIGGIAMVAHGSARVQLCEREVYVLSLDALERAKRAAGRAKDLMDLAEIAVIRRKGG
jgi:hypothetical protein